MKRVQLLLLSSLVTVAAFGQAPPPPVIAPAAPTNMTPKATNAAVTATNAATTNVPAALTNLLDARRRALQNVTNQAVRPGTNAPAAPALRPPPTAATAVKTTAPTAAQPPGVERQVATPAAPAPLPITRNPVVTRAGEPADVILKFYNAPADQIFEKYSELTGRTVLRPANLTTPITIINYTPLTRTEAVQALNGALALNSITMIDQGEKFVKAVPSQQAPQEGAGITKLKDGELPDTEEWVTRVMQLKTAKPSEVAQLLTSFTKNPTGIVPIDSNSILVIRDFASNVRRMEELIEQVDVTPESDYKLEVIPIKYGKVTDLFDTMNALISGGGGGGYTGSSRAAAQQRGGTLPTSRGAFGTTGRYGSYGARTGNAFGQPGVNPLQSGITQPTATPGNSFQDRLRQIVNRAAGASEFQLLTDARIVPDERSNSLIVFANKEDIKMITNIVSKVDVLLAQVLIKGVVLSVALNDQQDLGISWLQNPRRFDQNFTGAGGINNGQSFLGNLTNGLAASLPSGFSYFGKLGKDFDVSLAALASDSRVKIVQEPTLQTSHAVPGFFFTGSTVPYVTGFYDYGFGTGVSSRSQVEQVQVGVQLQVTPFITPDGLVVLDIDQDISSLESFVKIDNNDVPTTSSRHATATLSVRDGETIMLGGYIEDNRSNTKSGVPILKDIPGLGALFRSKGHKNDRKELLLLMHVKILKSPEDASAQVEAEKNKLPGISEADKEFKETEEKSRKKAGLQP